MSRSADFVNIDTEVNEIPSFKVTMHDEKSGRSEEFMSTSKVYLAEIFL